MKTVALLMSLVLAAVVQAGTTPLKVDADQSRVEIVVKATVDSFTGELSTYQAEVAIDPATHQAVAATVSFSFKDVKTGKTDRDEQMHKWQATLTYPDGKYVMSSIAKGADGRLHAKGTLTFHGVTKDIEFPVTIISDGGLYAIDGEATLDTREYGLPIIRKFAILKVDPVVRVRFHLQGNLES